MRNAPSDLNHARKIIFLLVGCAAAATLGAAAFFGIISPGPEAPSRPPVYSTARASLPARPLATAVPTASPSPVNAVAVDLTSVDRQPSLGGVTVTITLTNHQQSPLTFSFDPSYDLRLTDALGHTWDLRWAEYAGSPRVAVGEQIRLVRAFFAGPVDRATVWPLQIRLSRLPGGGTQTWRIPRSGAIAPAPGQPPPPPPTVAASGPISLSVENVQPSSGLGGVQIDLILHNARAVDLVFQFDPDAQLSAADELGRPYHVRWAQYNGTVHVGPDATVRLARVFLEGPIADGRAAWLMVQLARLPGAAPLRSIVALG